MKRPASGEDNLGASAPGAESARISRSAAPSSPAFGRDRNEFRELLDFLEEAELDRVGCFAYSPVQGARANELPARFRTTFAKTA